MEFYLIYSSDEDGNRVVEAATDSFSLAEQTAHKLNEGDPNKDYFIAEPLFINDEAEAEELINDLLPDDEEAE